MQLYELQRRLTRAILANSLEPLKSEFFVFGGASVLDRLSIYHDNVIGTWLEALASVYGATLKLVGQTFFDEMARQFVSVTGASSWDLNRYGEGFPAFIRGYPPATSLPYLSDVAHFEWLWNECFLAANDKALSPADLSRIEERNLVHLELRPREQVRLFTSPYPVDAIWAYCEEQRETVPDISAGAFFMAVMRPNLDVNVVRLSRAEHGMLQAFFAGHTVEEATGLAIAADGTFDLGAFMARHFALQTFQSPAV